MNQSNRGMRRQMNILDDAMANDVTAGVDLKDFYCQTATVYIPKIINGSLLSFGGDIRKTILKVDQHFNWFQKLMWKWCFGIKVEDYSEEQ